MGSKVYRHPNTHQYGAKRCRIKIQMPPGQKSNHAFNNFPALVVALPAKGAPSSLLAIAAVTFFFHQENSKTDKMVCRNDLEVKKLICNNQQPINDSIII